MNNLYSVNRIEGYQKIVEDILENLKEDSGILLCEGDLGAGKTTFARIFIRHLCKNPCEEVPSPTFTLVQYYQTPTGRDIHHYDLYRLHHPDELTEIGFDASLNKRGVVIVEWPEKLGHYMPNCYYRLHFKEISDDMREVRVTKYDG